MEQILRKLQETLENPGFYRALSPEEQAELFLYLFQPKTKKKAKVIKGIDGVTPVKDKDYLSKETTESLIRDLAKKTKAELEQIVATKLKNVAKPKDGKDAEITDELIVRIAELAQSLIVLPDFPTLITMEPEAIRDSLELLPDGEKLAQEAIEGLPKRLEQLEKRPPQIIQNSGIGKGQVYGFIKQAVADGTIPAGGEGGGVTDHGALTGLADDDHTQYHTDARGDARYYTKSQVDTSLSGKADTTHTHAISDVTGLQTALDGKAPSLGVDDNYVTDAEKTKLSNLSGTNTGDQDLSSYLTSATAASTYEPLKGADDNFVTDAEKTKLSNLSGTNSGDQTGIVGITGTKAEFDTAVTDGNFMYVGDAPTAHTHVISDTTGLQTALDGKAATSHTHTISDIVNLTVGTTPPVSPSIGDIWIDTN